MSDSYVGEIRIFAGNFAPRGWALCNGQTLAISQNTALFSVLGTTYGGDGKSTFALPDLQGRAPMQQGQGAGLSKRDLGKSGGAATVALSESGLPAHAHQPGCSSSTAATASPIGAVWAVSQRGKGALYSPTAGDTMSSQAIAPAGGGQPHNNMQPYLGLTFIISLQGDYPVRE